MRSKDDVVGQDWDQTSGVVVQVDVLKIMGENASSYLNMVVEIHHQVVHGVTCKPDYIQH